MAVKNSPDLNLNIKSVRKKFSKALHLDSKTKQEGEPYEQPGKCCDARDSSISACESKIQPLVMNVQYLGYAELKSPGLEEICVRVDKMYASAKPYLKTFEKTKVEISRAGICLKQEYAKETFYKSRRVLYCGVDRQHQRVFSFNYQHGSRAENIHLHVLVCKTKESARILAKYLGRIFKRISKDEHKRELEDKRKHSEGLTKSRTRSSQSLHTYSNMFYPNKTSYSTNGSEDNTRGSGTCGSGTCGSGEWSPDDERVMTPLSVA